MRFVKMHGLGNDYVYVNGLATRRADWPALAVAVSDRHTGVGADGLIVLLPSRRADFRMRMFNADGSEGEMCGNGIRCLAKLAWDLRLTRRRDLVFETPAGPIRTRMARYDATEARVTVDMGAPRPLKVPPAPRRPGAEPPTLIVDTLDVAGTSFRIHEVSMGNPHCVLFVPDVTAAPVARIGPLLERHPRFPNRTNVEFVQVLSRSEVRQRTWERGSGETMACGTGACATAVAAHRTGRTGPRVTVHLLGGDLRIEIARDGRVFMTGPAVTVFQGTW
jgi:diaminopimelate epimerase